MSKLHLKLFTECGMTVNAAKSTAVISLRGSAAHRWLRCNSQKVQNTVYLNFGTPTEPIWIPRSQSMVYLGIVASYTGFEMQTLRHTGFARACRRGKDSFASCTPTYSASSTDCGSTPLVSRAPSCMVCMQWVSILLCCKNWSHGTRAPCVQLPNRRCTCRGKATGSGPFHSQGGARSHSRGGALPSTN